MDTKAKKFLPLISALLKIGPNAEIQIEDRHSCEPIYIYPNHLNKMAPVLQKNLDKDFCLSLSLPTSEQIPMVLRALEGIIDNYILISQQQFSVEAIVSQRRMLMDYLFRSDASKNTTNIFLLADEMGIDLTLHRFVCLFDYANLTQVPAFSPAKFFSIFRDYLTEKLPHSDQLLTLEYNSCQYVICVPALRPELPSGEYLSSILNDLNQCLKSYYSSGCHIGVGSCVNQVNDYEKSLLAAQMALRFGTPYSDTKIHYIDNYLLEYDVENIMSSKLQSYLLPYLQKLKSNPKLCDTAKALLSSNLDYSIASKMLYIHKNTFLKQMHILREELHLDPVRSDSDCLLLMILLQCIKAKYSID